jgi:hypothetical protein
LPFLVSSADQVHTPHLAADILKGYPRKKHIDQKIDQKIDLLFANIFHCDEVHPGTSYFLITHPAKSYNIRQTYTTNSYDLP